jgi:hypothetical protein
MLRRGLLGLALTALTGDVEIKDAYRSVMGVAHLVPGSMGDRLSGM